jgi:hypothetical protein
MSKTDIQETSTMMVTFKSSAGVIGETKYINFSKTITLDRLKKTIFSAFSKIDIMEIQKLKMLSMMGGIDITSMVILDNIGVIITDEIFEEMRPTFDSCSIRIYMSVDDASYYG